MAGTSPAMTTLFTLRHNCPAMTKTGFVFTVVGDKALALQSWRDGNQHHNLDR